MSFVMDLAIFLAVFSLVIRWIFQKSLVEAANENFLYDLSIHSSFFKGAELPVEDLQEQLSNIAKMNQSGLTHPSKSSIALIKAPSSKPLEKGSNFKIAELIKDSMMASSTVASSVSSSLSHDRHDDLIEQDFTFSSNESFTQIDLIRGVIVSEILSRPKGWF